MNKYNGMWSAEDNTERICFMSYYISLINFWKYSEFDAIWARDDGEL